MQTPRIIFKRQLIVETTARFMIHGRLVRMDVDRREEYIRHGKKSKHVISIFQYSLYTLLLIV